jgi:hypothetical protein
MIDFSKLHPVSPVLTGLVSTTRPKIADMLIGRSLLPRVQVENKWYTGTIFVDTHIGFMGDPQGLERAPGAPMATSGTGDPTTVTYTTKLYSLASNPIPLENIERSQLPENLGDREALAVQNKLAIAEEIRIATLIFTAANWTSTVACTAITNGSTAKFSNAAAGKPLNDIARAIEMFSIQAHGALPTDIVVGRQVALDLAVHPEIRGLYLVTSGAGGVSRPVNEAALKELFLDTFGVKLHVGKLRYNTAALGQAASDAYAWTDSMWIGCLSDPNARTNGPLVYSDQTAAVGIDEISNFAPQGAAAISNLVVPMIAGLEYQPATLGNSVKAWAQQACCEKVLAADLGFVVTDCN